MTRPGSTLDPRDFAAVLFDMDGTLVDSEPIWFDVLRSVVGEFGGDLPAHEHGVLHGNDRATSTGILQREFGMTGDVTAFWARVVERLDVAIERVPAMPNAGVWVETVAAAGRPRAVVSNSPRSMVEASLSGQSWGHQLPVRISADDVERGKPHPDGYLLAARRLGVDPARSLVVEDSEAGARAAIAAGATCLFVTNGFVDDARARAITPHVVPHLPDLPHLPHLPHPGDRPGG